MFKTLLTKGGHLDVFAATFCLSWNQRSSLQIWAWHRQWALPFLCKIPWVPAKIAQNDNGKKNIEGRDKLWEVFAALCLPLWEISSSCSPMFPCTWETRLAWDLAGFAVWPEEQKLSWILDDVRLALCSTALSPGLRSYKMLGTGVKAPRSTPPDQKRGSGKCTEVKAPAWKGQGRRVVIW